MLELPENSATLKLQESRYEHRLPLAIMSGYRRRLSEYDSQSSRA